MNSPTATDPGRQAARQLALRSGLAFVTIDPAGANPDEHMPINPLAARLLSEQVCRHFTMLPISYADGVVTVAIATAFTGQAATQRPQPLQRVGSITGVATPPAARRKRIASRSHCSPQVRQMTLSPCCSAC